MGINRDDLSVLGFTFPGSQPSLAHVTGDAWYERANLIALKKPSMSTGREAPYLI